MMPLPAPLVPPNVDLTDFKFMPLEIERLRRSRAWLLCRRKPEIGFYALNLWARSWHERPAASIEDDDDVLADAAMCATDRWPEVRADALRGWVKCSDGRLYHPTVAEKATEAWKRKCEQRVRTLKARIAAMEKRLAKVETETDRSHIRDMLAGLNAELLQAITTPTQAVTKPVTDPVTETKGQGQGERQGQGDYIPGAKAPDATESVTDPDAAFALYVEAAKRAGWTVPRKLDTDRRKAINRILKEWDGLDGWRTALEIAERSDWIMGRTGRAAGHENWRLDLDFLTRPKSHRRLMEGGYGGMPATTGAKAESWGAHIP